jgi:hypothetical protein
MSRSFASVVFRNLLEINPYAMAEYSNEFPTTVPSGENSSFDEPEKAEASMLPGARSTLDITDKKMDFTLSSKPRHDEKEIPTDNAKMTLYFLTATCLSPKALAVHCHSSHPTPILET